MSKPIKLLLLIPHLGGGGAERVMAQLARHLDPQRFEIHLGLIGEDFPGAPKLPEWVRIHRLNKYRVRQAWLPILQQAWQVKPDVILSGMAHLNFVVLLLKPLLGRRTRLLVRQNTTASAAATTWQARLLYRSLYPCADGILCQSEAMARDLAENFRIRSAKLAVLPNPIDALSPGTVSAPSSVWPEDAWPRLLAVGRLSPEKGIDLLLHAASLLKREFPRMHAIVLGTGPEEDKLRRLQTDLKLETAVALLGHSDRVADYYEDATLFVQPSRYEGMPNALLEAARAGLPIVSTPSSAGLQELLEDEPGAWIASATDVVSLAKALERALVHLGFDPPRRFAHAFLAPFETKMAIAAYAAFLEEQARKARR